MHELTEMIRRDMKPALGVTEPGAIAFAVAEARRHTAGEVKRIRVRMNSGMYKNAFTCGIPGISEVGSAWAAALGAVAGDPDRGLEALASVTEEDHREAGRLLQEGRVEVSLDQISSRIFIEADVEAGQDTAAVTIRDSHTKIVKIEVNGKVTFETPAHQDGTEEEMHPVHRYTLQELTDYIETVDPEELEFLWQAHEMNLKLFQTGLDSDRTTFLPYLLQKNGGRVISSDEQATASLLCNGAIEARVLGLDAPAMSITGSGAHGIIATLPLYAAWKVSGYSKEKLLRATALSDLICMYIKEYSGKLSAFCGCAIAAGSGAACALVWLRGGTVRQMTLALQNMAGSITGMICDGGNLGCTMKGIAAVDAAYRSAGLAMQGIGVPAVHGINGWTPEETMRNMGRIAFPGMTGTEKTIVEIFEEKAGRGPSQSDSV